MLRADNLKMTFPIAAAVLSMAWGVVTLPEGAAVDPSVLAELRWGADYLSACLITNSSLVVQARAPLLPKAGSCPAQKGCLHEKGAFPLLAKLC
jgi:hypothetical protein